LKAVSAMKQLFLYLQYLLKRITMRKLTTLIWFLSSFQFIHAQTRQELATQLFSSSNNFQTSLFKEANRVGGNNGFVTTFDNGENVVGTPFLLDYFTFGRIATEDSIFNPQINYFINYYKISQKIVITQDNDNYFVIEDPKVKFATIKCDTGLIRFEKVPVITNDYFVQLLSGNSNVDYRLYRSIKSKFKKALNQNNGLINNSSTQNTYEDEFIYYIVTPNDNGIKKLTLTKKDKSSILDLNKEKVTQFIGDYKNLFYNEQFYKDLVLFLNQ
jgi:hypothetical protein